MTITEAPLVAGLGSTEFAGLNVIASAFYVDFDSAAMRNLPELIREQRSSVEQSLEWTVGYLVAQQWWGVAVGNDPGARQYWMKRYPAGRHSCITRKCIAHSRLRQC